MKLEVASLSHIGQVRQRNEDALGHFEPAEKAVREDKGSMFIVADGMGGASACRDRSCWKRVRGPDAPARCG